MSLVIQICQNNLSFSLYTALFICLVVITSDKWMKSETGVSANVGLSPLNTED